MCLAYDDDVEGCLRGPTHFKPVANGAGIPPKSSRRRCGLRDTADDVIVLWRGRIKQVFRSAWSVHVVKCSKLKYFLRGFPPPEATPGVVLIDTSPAPDLDMTMIRRQHPGDVRKEEIRP